MEDFHEDIQSKILSDVPRESVLNCKLVCKTWQKLLAGRKGSLGILFSVSRASENPLASKIRLYYAGYDVISTKHKEDSYMTRLTKINLPPVKRRSEEQQFIIGSCNGLVCLALPHAGVYDPVCICNPFTTEYTILPRISNIKSSHSWDVVSGFGYLPSTKEYKVVRILYRADKSNNPSSTTRKGQVQVYTLGSRNGWRNVTETEHSFLFSVGILANESLYWKNENSSMIVAFDLADEIFRVLPQPLCIQLLREQKKEFSLITLGGYLCLVDDHPDYDCINIWSFRMNKHPANKSSYGVAEQDYYQGWSWRKDFSIQREKNGVFHQPFALRNNNDILLWTKSTLKRYDLITKSLSVTVHSFSTFGGIPHMNTLVFMDDRNSSSFGTFKGILHMNTLVSLKDLGVNSNTWVRHASGETQLISRKRARLEDIFVRKRFKIKTS